MAKTLTINISYETADELVKAVLLDSLRNLKNDTQVDNSLASSLYIVLCDMANRQEQRELAQEFEDWLEGI